MVSCACRTFAVHLTALQASSPPGLRSARGDAVRMLRRCFYKFSAFYFL